jgi:hypothetical protein
MADVKITYDAAIEYQESDAISADSFSAGASIVNDNDANGHAYIDMFVVVSSQPSSAAKCELWENKSMDDIIYGQDEYVSRIPIPASAGTYHLGVVPLSKFSKFKLKAIDYGFTASLIGVPQQTEIN